MSHFSTERAIVILSAGTIGTARIALNSGLRLHNPLVGKGLMDHEIYYTRIAIERTTGAPSHPLNLQCVIKVDEGQLALLTVTINANFFLSGSTNLQTGQYLSADGSLLQPQSSGWLEMKNFDTIAILLQFGAPLDDNNEVLNLPTPDPVIRVRRPILHSRLPSKVQDKLAEIRNVILEKIIKPISLNKGNLDLLPAVPPLTLLGFGVFSHEVGTMRMKGPGDNELGVVNTDLQVNYFKNLYVCDLSVFPYSPPANPSLTLTALSLRLSDHLEPNSRPQVSPHVRCFISSLL